MKTYKVTVKCGNCGKDGTYVIPVGQSLKNYFYVFGGLAKKPCKHCGCGVGEWGL